MHYALVAFLQQYIWAQVRNAAGLRNFLLKAIITKWTMRWGCHTSHRETATMFWYFAARAFEIFGGWLSIQWLVAVASYPLKMHPLIDWCNGWYLVQGGSQVCWWLNAEARKYMNTVVGDAPKIWRWKCFKRKFTNAINATIRRWCNMRDRIVKLDLSTQWDLCLPSI